MNKISLNPIWLVLSILVCSNGLFSQVKSPVSISYHSKKVSSNTYELTANLSIAPHWHVYSLKAGEGPVSSSFEVYNPTSNPWIEVLGKTKEKGTLIKKYEKVFETDVAFFEKEVSFAILVKKNPSKKSLCVPVKLEYMVCNDTECLPPTTKSTCIVIK